MNTDIAIVTKPEDLGQLLDPKGPQRSNPAEVPDGASVEEILARIEKDKTKPVPKIEVQMEKTPLTLKYQFTGVDAQGHPVKTLTVDTDAGYYVIAYCLAEDKEIKSMKVAKLPAEELKSVDPNIRKVKDAAQA